MHTGQTRVRSPSARLPRSTGKSKLAKPFPPPHVVAAISSALVGPSVQTSFPSVFQGRFSASSYILYRERESREASVGGTRTRILSVRIPATVRHVRRRFRLRYVRPFYTLLYSVKTVEFHKSLLFRFSRLNRLPTPDLYEHRSKELTILAVIGVCVC